MSGEQTLEVKRIKESFNALRLHPTVWLPVMSTTVECAHYLWQEADVMLAKKSGSTKQTIDNMAQVNDLSHTVGHLEEELPLNLGSCTMRL